MRLIVGLGNPGPEYVRTRHNAGFMLADRIASVHGLALHADAWRQQFHGLTASGMIAGEKVVVLKPMTFMNRSGLAVGEAANFYKLDPSDVLVLVDEIALDAGVIRLRARGSAGGHNGLKDIERVLATRDYPRLRLGVDAPGRVRQVDYVLSTFSPDQRDRIDEALGQGVRAVEMWLDEGIDKAMSIFNASA